MHPPESNEGTQNMEDIKKSIANLSPEARKDVVTETLKTILDANEARRGVAAEAPHAPLPGATDARKEAAAQAVRALPAEAKRAVTAEAVRALPVEAKRDVAAEAVRALPTGAKRDVAAEAILALPPRQQEALAELFLPDQGVTNRIWQVIVWAFAIVFGMSSAALVVAVFVGPEDIQLLLTVVTTIAGVLAGFVSGRASSGSTGRPGSGGTLPGPGETST